MPKNQLKKNHADGFLASPPAQTTVEIRMGFCGYFELVARSLRNAFLFQMGKEDADDKLKFKTVAAEEQPGHAYVVSKPGEPVLNPKDKETFELKKFGSFHM